MVSSIGSGPGPESPATRPSPGQSVQADAFGLGLFEIVVWESTETADAA